MDLIFLIFAILLVLLILIAPELFTKLYLENHCRCDCHKKHLAKSATLTLTEIQ